MEQSIACTLHNTPSNTILNGVDNDNNLVLSNRTLDAYHTYKIPS
jgi:hypothetical protein